MEIQVLKTKNLFDELRDDILNTKNSMIEKYKAKVKKTKQICTTFFDRVERDFSTTSKQVSSLETTFN